MSWGDTSPDEDMMNAVIDHTDRERIICVGVGPKIDGKKLKGGLEQMQRTKQKLLCFFSSIIIPDMAWPVPSPSIGKVSAIRGLYSSNQLFEHSHKEGLWRPLKTGGLS